MLKCIFALLIVTLGMTSTVHAEAWMPSQMLWKCWNGDLAVQEMPLREFLSPAARTLGIDEPDTEILLRQAGLIVTTSEGRKLVRQDLVLRFMKIFADPKSHLLWTYQEIAALIKSGSLDPSTVALGSSDPAGCSATVNPDSILARALIPFSKLLFKGAIEALKNGGYGSMWAGFIPFDKAEALLLAQSEREGKKGVFLLSLEQMSGTLTIHIYYTTDNPNPGRPYIVNDEKITLTPDAHHFLFTGAKYDTLTKIINLPRLTNIMRTPCIDAHLAVNRLPTLEKLPPSLGDLRLFGFEGFHGIMSKDQAERFLSGKNQGSYLLRMSDSSIGVLLSVVVSDGRVSTYVLNRLGTGEGRVTVEREGGRSIVFPSLLALLIVYSSSPPVTPGIPAAKALLDKAVSPHDYQENYFCPPIAEFITEVSSAFANLANTQVGLADYKGASEWYQSAYQGFIFTGNHEAAVLNRGLAEAYRAVVTFGTMNATNESEINRIESQRVSFLENALVTVDNSLAAALDSPHAGLSSDEKIVALRSQAARLQAALERVHSAAAAALDRLIES